MTTKRESELKDAFNDVSKESSKQFDEDTIESLSAMFPPKDKSN